MASSREYMKISKIELRQIQIPFLKPFSISKYTFTSNNAIIIKIDSDNGLSGWGECPCLETPWYLPETVETDWIALVQYFIPAILNEIFLTATDLYKHIDWIQGNNVARAGIDAAVLDLFAQEKHQSLAQYLGGTRIQVESGCSIGIHENIEDLYREIQSKLAIGYRRIKLKIKPGKDLTVIKEVRQKFPTISLMVDANSAYTLADQIHLKQFEAFNLLMMEQPLANGDICDHAELQANVKIPICLDESVHTLEDARIAIRLKACQIINIKPPRVGGLQNAQKIHDYCQQYYIPVWCGGMLETGIGRASNLAIASLPNFSLPGDLNAPTEYLQNDIIHWDFKVNHEGLQPVPTAPGLGVEIDTETLEKYTVKKQIFS